MSGEIRNVDFSDLDEFDSRQDTDEVAVQRGTTVGRMALSTVGAGGGGGLDQAAVDARVRAGVQDWAETGNTSTIPDSKIPSGIARDSELRTDSEVGEAAFENPPDDLTSTQQQAVRTAIGAGSGGGGGGDLTGIDAGTGIRVDDADTATPEVNIADGGVGTTQLADDAVTSAKIADDSIGPDQLDSDDGAKAAALRAEMSLLGGSLYIKDIAGSGDVTLTRDESTYEVIRLTGVLTGDRKVIFHADTPTGIREIANGTTGGHTVSVAKGTGNATALVAGRNYLRSGAAAFSTLQLRMQDINPGSIGPQQFDANTEIKRAAIRTRIGAGTSDFSGAYADLTGTKPPTDAEANPAEVSNAEIDAGTETAERSWSPADVKRAVEEHESDTATPRAAGTGLSLSGNALNVDHPAAETGAQVNPPHTLKFSAIDSDTSDSIGDGEIGIYNGATQIQPPHGINTVTKIHLPYEAAAFGVDAASPSADLDAQDLRPFMRDALDNNGDLLVAIVPHGGVVSDTVFGQVTNVVARTGGWTLTVSETTGSYSAASEGIGWNVVIGRTVASFASAIVDLAEVLAAYVKRTELEGHEDDGFYSYGNAFFAITGDRRGAMALFTGTTAPTDDTNIVAQPDISSLAAGGVAAGLPRTNPDPNVWSPAASFDVSKLTSGTPVHFVFEGHKNPGHFRVVLSADAVVTGTGNSQWIWLPGVVTEVGDVSPADEGDWVRMSFVEPSGLDILIPYQDVLGVDLGNVLTLD